jgi:uncharacterized protein YndB with AHSA1/START domain
MANQTDAPQPPPLAISRVFHANPETVFKAWSSADHVKRWFSPATYSVPEANVQMHEGGKFEVCMRAPDGTAHWTRGKFLDVSPHTLLVIEMHVADDAGAPVFRVLTEVTFAKVLAGTRMDVVQSYTFIDPSAAAPMVAGASEGWRTTLDKLAAEVSRMQGGEAGTRSAAHGSFHIARTYDAPVARVWRALTEEAAKNQWFGGPPDRWEPLERFMDVRPGGKERAKGRWDGGVVSTFDATYFDVIPNQRLVYAYEMHLDDRKISVSLATMELRQDAAGTMVKITEQGAFLDGYDDAGSREHGTYGLLDALGAFLSA